jgi:hypothetical protein
VKTNLASPSDARTVTAGVRPRKCVFGIPISSPVQSSCRYSWLSAPPCGARRRCRVGVAQHGPCTVCSSASPFLRAMVLLLLRNVLDCPPWYATMSIPQRTDAASHEPYLRKSGTLRE